MAFSHSDKTDGLDRPLVSDAMNSSALEATITATTTAQVAKVGVSNLSDRKYVFIEAHDNGVLWGFSTSCLFNAFKNSAIWIPAGPEVNVYVKTSGGSKSVAIAEGA